MIRAENITKKFGDFKALDSMNLHAKSGSVYGLIGPNGAGKTTFIKALTGVYKCDEGKITVKGKNVFEDISAKFKMVYISDDLFYYPTYSILETAKYYAGIYPGWSWEDFEKMKEIFKIDVKKKVRRLSKGTQKQVAFWLGMSARPDVMILDEPVDGLDPVMRRNVWKLMLQAVEEREMTVLVSSHNLRELEDVCDHVGIMFDGKIVIEKSLSDVKGNIHKLQIAFPGGKIPDELEKSLTILDKSGFGSVSLLIVKGDGKEIEEMAKQYSPIVCDVLPLTLEEVFIYELGGMGYEFENIVL